MAEKAQRDVMAKREKIRRRCQEHFPRKNSERWGRPWPDLEAERRFGRQFGALLAPLW